MARSATGAPSPSLRSAQSPVSRPLRRNYRVLAGDFCIESKPLKLYLSGYRNEGRFCEALAVKIRDDVAEALELAADKVQVTLRQKARGGISIAATS